MADHEAMSEALRRLKSASDYDALAARLAEAERERDRLRDGLRLIAEDTHRLMNTAARQAAESILGGKPIHDTDTAGSDE